MPTPIPIIMLNWNGLEDTLEAMEAVFQQSYVDFRVYLVDNGSNAGDVAGLKAHFGDHPKVNLVFNKENLGFTRGNNLILSEILKLDTVPEFVALLNNDTAVDPNWLENLIKAANDHQADVISSKMVNYFSRGQMDNAGHRMINTGEVIALGHMQLTEEWENSFENFGSCAGATLYRSKMLLKVGIFDEYFETGYEDAEMGIRATVAGYKCIYAPKAIAYHKISQSVNKVMNYEYLLKIHLNVYYSYLKLMPWPVLLVNLPSFIFKYLSMFIIDVVLFRFHFLKIMFDSIWKTATRERKTILKARRKFFKEQKVISSWSILRKMDFFLWFDIKRLWNTVILKKPTKFST